MSKPESANCRCFFIQPRYRVLYLLYEHKQLSYAQFLDYFSKDEIDTLRGLLENLFLERVIVQDNDDYKLREPCMDLFLRVYDFFCHIDYPIPMSEIKDKFRQKAVSQIVDQLLRADVFFEYRTSLSKQSYVFLRSRKDQMIQKIDLMLVDSLQSSHKLIQQAHLVMIQNDQNISHYADERINYLLDNDYQRRIINHYLGYGYPIFQSEDELLPLFGNDHDVMAKIVLSLVGKNVMRCSYMSGFYVNERFWLKVKRDKMYAKRNKLKIRVNS